MSCFKTSVAISKVIRAANLIYLRIVVGLLSESITAAVVTLIIAHGICSAAAGGLPEQ